LLHFFSKKETSMNTQINLPSSLKSSLLRDTRGLSTVEYIILLVLIAVGGIQVWSSFGETVRNKISSSTNEVESME